MTDSSARPVLPALIKGNTGRLTESGGVAVGRFEPAAIALYGPYWQLAAGSYRLEFVCERVEVRDQGTIFMGVEVVVDDRLYLAAADYSLADLREGGSLAFEMPAELAVGVAAPGLVEFRFLNYGGAAFVIASAVLRQCPNGATVSASRLEWRLAPRVRRRWRPWRSLPWKNRVLASLVCHWVTFAPPIKLPDGRYELSFTMPPGRVPIGGSSFEVAVTVGGHLLATQRFVASDRRVPCTVQFAVPEAHSYAHGAADPLELVVSGGAFIAPFELRRLDGPANGPSAPAITGPSAATVVIIGNCQAGLLTEGFRDLLAPRALRAKYHFVQLAERFHQSARADLANANFVLIQDISDFARYPLQPEIPASAEIHRFPMLNHATPWPFDTHAGLQDRAAAEREALEPMFLNLDGVLGRLRREVPDPSDRFEIYRRLDIDWLPDIERLARYEERRLEAMDRKYGCTLGAYVLDNFRKRPVMHSIGHPRQALFGELLQHLRGLMGLKKTWLIPAKMGLLENVEVPVHPLVGERLGIRWATADRLYYFRNQRLTWADYTRRYIGHFG